MKKIYIMASLIIAVANYAQNNFSFENSEGYTLGDINGQNGWSVTENSSGPIKSQFISNEYSNDGSFSFKNAHESSFGDQPMPIMGVHKAFTTPLDYKNTSISYSFFTPAKADSDFEFAIYAEDKVNDLYDTLLAVGFENRGNIYVWSENFNSFDYANATWTPNKWYTMKIDITENLITYYLDNVKIYEIANNTKLNIDGMNFLHNNYGGSAYYDNIKINDIDLATYEAQVSKAVKIYPNPAKDIVTLRTDENITEFNIYNMAGQKVKTGHNSENIDIRPLAKGNYILQVKTISGKTISSKLIKN